ncbi:hypothetical protein QJS66_22390 [Kocuria rhizophila]|nr:hypothetical protein QJS66_22390 [Kocuria rhizophila]
MTLPFAEFGAGPSWRLCRERTTAEQVPLASPSPRTWASPKMRGPHPALTGRPD